MGGLFNNIVSSFLQDRSDDFVRLETTKDGFGPGPVILLYSSGSYSSSSLRGIDDEEFHDMIADGAPIASKQGPVIFRRIEPHNDDDLLECTVREVLETILNKKNKNKPPSSSLTAVLKPEKSEEGEEEEDKNDNINNDGIGIPCPVLYFSGISNSEMMSTYRIIAGQIYEETGGMANTACAKAVPPAMEKSLRQVLEEISSDHMDATASAGADDDDADSAET